jgi:hypothetical protein
MGIVRNPFVFYVGFFFIVDHRRRAAASWYTNPQSEAFCSMLGLENKINPAPPQVHVAAVETVAPPPVAESS